MAQSVKEMLIRINGEVGSGMSQIGSSLSQIGAALDQVGGKVREFEKESLNIYRGYEDEMLAAKYAMSASVESASQLEKQMQGLDNAAQEWAASSIFHTDDVSRAINNAAHAGWEYEEILEGIPQAMLIAQAGGLDLSEGLDYLIKMMNSTKTPMSEMGTLVDQWAMASNSSATNIGEMGDAFRALGSTASFGDSTAELFTMLAALANVGTTGSQAGTALRATMMRLVAPTTKAEQAMELLGADSEELQEVLADENVTKAAKTLQGLGFSAYTSSGKLKPMRQIFKELYSLTEGLDDAAKNEIMSAIFPSRTIASALSLLSASNDELDELYGKISNSGGYAEKGAKIMMSGLSGSLETFSSKWEEFQRQIGETLAPHVETITDALSHMMDGLNSLPPEVMEGITSMLTALAAAGPLLLGVGAVAKFVGFLGPIGSAAVAAGLGTAFLIGYLNKLNEIELNEKFGTLDLDLETLNGYVDSIETKFDKEQKVIIGWSQAVQEAQKNYTNAVDKMNDSLLKKVLTGGAFTEDDYNEFKALGDNIVKYTLEGIESSEARDMSLLDAIFGDKQTDEESEAFDNAAALLDFHYQELEEEARALGAKISAKWAEGLNAGGLTNEDREVIQSWVDRLNAINAEVAARMRRQEYEKERLRAGRVSRESLGDFLTENGEKLTAQKEAINQQYDEVVSALRLAEEDARAHGDQYLEFTDTAGNKRKIDLSDKRDENGQTAMDRMYAEVEREHQASLTEEENKYGDVSMMAFDAAMRDNFSDAWSFLKDIQNGKTADEILSGMKREQAESTLAQLESLAAVNRQGEFKYLEPMQKAPAVAKALTMLAELTENGALGSAETFMTGAQDDYFGYWTDNGYVRYDEEEGPNYDNEPLPATQEEIDLAVNDEAVQEWEAPEEEGIVNLAVNDEAVQEWEAPPKTMTVDAITRFAESTSGGAESVDGFAEGGRATEASIFGEAGPEWAIPEEHSSRTAALLDAARKASGFTWAELLTRYGGLNANPDNAPVVLNYSPVINAGDATGVAGALAADKDKVLKLIRQALEEARYRESVEVFA